MAVNTSESKRFVTNSWRQNLSYCVIVLSLCISTILTQENDVFVHSLEPEQVSCPEKDDIIPCICSFDGATNIDIDCSAVKDEAELSLVFSNSSFPYLNFRQLIISHKGYENLVLLNETTFGNATFELVEITGTKLETFQGDVFQKSHAWLRRLILFNNSLTYFSIDSPSYTSLRDLNLGHNKLMTVPFYRSNSIQVLILSSNRGLTLHRGNFQFLHNLEEIYLDNIGFTTLPTEMFSKNDGKLILVSMLENEFQTLESGSITSNGSLLYLFLSRNSLKDIEAGAITGLAPNAIIDINSNNISVIPEDVWGTIFEEISPSGVINFSDNPLICGCDIAWIILGEDNLQKVDNKTTCAGGELLHQLPPEAFEYHCPDG